MPWQMWFFIIVGGLALAVFIGSVVGKVFLRADTEGGLIGSVVVGFIACLVLLTGCFTIVGTRQVGIATTFGKPTGETLSNGLHWTAPWVEVTELDESIQNDTYHGDNRILVRLGNNSTAKADVSIRWQIKQNAADKLFVDYKTFDNVRSNLITRNLQAALNEVFASFDPLSAKNLETSQLPALAQDTLKKLQTKVGDQVEIFDVVIPTIDYDDSTEAKINQLNAERANTAVAEQSQKTATAQADANQKLSASVAHDPNVIVANCIAKAIEKGLSPLGCWPGTGALATVPAK